MNHSLLHAKLKLKELFRQPSYVAGTLLFPSLFFLFFALPNAESEAAANLLMGSFSAYAFLGVIFFQFGVDIANEKENPWYQFQTSLPVKSYHIFIGRVIAALVFALLAEWVLIVLVVLTTTASISIPALLKMSLFLCIASIPFAFLAGAIGRMFSAKAALPITNIFYLSMAFLGGMWIPPAALPDSIQTISEYMPTRHFVEIAWYYCSDTEFSINSVYQLLGFLIISLASYELSLKLSTGKTRL